MSEYFYFDQMKFATNLRMNKNKTAVSTTVDLVHIISS